MERRAQIDQGDQLATNVQEPADHRWCVRERGRQRGPLDLPHEIRTDPKALLIQLEAQQRLSAHDLIASLVDMRKQWPFGPVAA